MPVSSDFTRSGSARSRGSPKACALSESKPALQNSRSLLFELREFLELLASTTGGVTASGFRFSKLLRAFSSLTFSLHFSSLSLLFSPCLFFFKILFMFSSFLLTFLPFLSSSFPSPLFLLVSSSEASARPRARLRGSRRPRSSASRSSRRPRWCWQRELVLGRQRGRQRGGRGEVPGPGSASLSSLRPLQCLCLSGCQRSQGRGRKTMRR